MSGQAFRFCLLVVGALMVLSMSAEAQSMPGAKAVPGSPQEICPLLIGSQLPSLIVQSLDGKPFDLDAAIRAQPTVLIYFRGGW